MHVKKCMCSWQWTLGLEHFFFFVDKYDPENPKDAEELLEFLNDDELNEECEKMLRNLGETSDIDFFSDNDSDEDILLPFAPKTFRVGADKLSFENEKLQNKQLAEEEHATEYSEVIDSDSEDDIPLSIIAETLRAEVSNSRSEENKIPDCYKDIMSIITPKNNIIYRKNYEPISPQPECDFTFSPQTNEILMPIQYFLRYIPEQLFDVIAEMTNIYALQQGKTSFKPTHANEIKIFIALHIIMSCLKFPRIRMYWDVDFNMSLFRDNMARNRFFLLRNNLHIVNNLEKPNDCKDKLFKVRPLLDSIRKRCHELEVEKDLSIDEQMVPFRGQFSIKQYVKGKPNPWGIKIFVLCGRSGLMYDFIVYQGSTTEFDEFLLNKFGLGATSVLHLSQRIPEQRHLYFDNYFTTYNLLEILKYKKINAAGTIRVNRFNKPPLITDQQAKKKPRGFSEEIVSEGSEIILCKWSDNRSVVLASNFIGKGEEDEVKRWNKTNKQYVHVKRPQVVKMYNRSMGGVDKLDHLIALYRIYVRSRKWTLRMFFHGVDLAIVNSWLEYRQHYTDENKENPKEKALDLLHFRLQLAYSLMKMNIPVIRKRGRPSDASPSSSITSTPTHYCSERKRLFMEVRHDRLDHMPNYDSKKEATRCKFEKCTKKTHVFCDKCNLHLCFLKERNCFLSFHRK